MEGMNSTGVSFTDAEVKAIFTLADVNQDGEINYTEFVPAQFSTAADSLAKLRNALKDI